MRMYFSDKPVQCRELFRLATKHYERGEFEAAVLDYGNAIKLDPTRASIYFNRGQAYDALGSYSLAIWDYTKAIELKPKDAEAYFWRGDCHFKIREYEQALADYTSAARLGFKSDELHRYREQAEMFLLAEKERKQAQ